MVYVDHKGKFYIDEFNLSPYPIPTRLKSTTDLQHESRDTQTKPRGLRTTLKALPRGLSSITDAKWKSMPYAQPRRVRSTPDRDKSRSTSPTTSRSRFTPLTTRKEITTTEDLQDLDTLLSLDTTGK